MTNYVQLRDQINERFSQIEIKHLCFDLQVDYDNLEGDLKLSKITALIQYLNRRNRLDELFIRCSQLRPKVNWHLESETPPHKTRIIEDTLDRNFRGFPRPDVEKFLDTSGLSLTSIDGAILTYDYPFNRQDWGWQEHEIIFKHEDSLVSTELPNELHQISKTFRALNPNRRDSIKYCIDKMACSLNRNGLLRIEARSISYLLCYPIAQKLEEEILRPHLIRTRWFARLTSRQRPLSPNMLIAHVLVLTGDQKLVLQQRSANVDYFAGHWSASFEEHYNAPWQTYLYPQEIHEESVNVDSTSVIFQGIRRGLSEEFRLHDSDIAQTIVRVLGVGFEFSNFLNNIYAIVKLPKHCTFSAIKENLKSSSEHDRFTACSFEIDNLLGCIKLGDIPADLNKYSMAMAPYSTNANLFSSYSLLR